MIFCCRHIDQYHYSKTKHIQIFIHAPKQKIHLFTTIFKEKKVNRILFYGTKLDKQIYKDCLGKELYFKKNVGRYVGRNPFNRKELYYDGWIFELNYEKFPNCLVR